VRHPPVLILLITTGVVCTRAWCDGRVQPGGFVAAGIRYRGRVIAALNVSANAARLSVKELRERCAPMVIEHTEAISAEIATR
jgi:DNA-binding IclR family transcriptional regulator